MARDHYNDGRKTAIAVLNEKVKEGWKREAAAKQLFLLADGGFNTTKAEKLFDAGIRAQLNDLGFQED